MIDLLPALQAATIGRGFTASKMVVRQIIRAKEHDTLMLPSGLVNIDGSLDVYDDVIRLFKPTYQKKIPAIQCAGWIGYIPLNERYALEVDSRVPIGNLERLVGMANGYRPEVLRSYARKFGHARETPGSIIELLSDRLLDIFDHIWESGLLKTYNQVKRVGSSPAGRMMPFQSEWKTARAGRPLASSVAFYRTSDFGPNRLIRLAFDKIFVRCVGVPDDKHRSRMARLRKALIRLEDVGHPLRSDISPAAIARFIGRLPSHHEHYADALMVAQLFILDIGLSIRGSGEIAILPSILINMAKVFEDYIRHILSIGLVNDIGVSVRNGNKGGDGGAKLNLFDPVRAGFKNPPVTPDIVIDVNGKPSLIIDVKYKPSPMVPERDDTNQVVLYGARYASTRVMLVHSDRPAYRPNLEFCGNVGDFRVYNGMIDLNAADIELEEFNFIKSIRDIIT